MYADFMRSIPHYSTWSLWLADDARCSCAHSPVNAVSVREGRAARPAQRRLAAAPGPESWCTAPPKDRVGATSGSPGRRCPPL